MPVRPNLLFPFFRLSTECGTRGVLCVSLASARPRRCSDPGHLEDRPRRPRRTPPRAQHCPCRDTPRSREGFGVGHPSPDGPRASRTGLLMASAPACSRRSLTRSWVTLKSAPWSPSSTRGPASTRAALTAAPTAGVPSLSSEPDVREPGMLGCCLLGPRGRVWCR